MSGRPLWERLERLLHRERLASMMEHRDLMALPVDERVERGETLAGLTLAVEDRTGLRLRCPDNQSKFRPGDALRLGNGDHGAPGIAVVYESYDERSGVVTVSRDLYRRDGSLDPSRPLQLDPENTSLVDLALDALSVLRKRRDPAAAAARAMLEPDGPGTSGPGDHDPADLALAETLASDPRSALDASKRAALREAIARCPAGLVQGPPGSGKTHLLAAVASALARRGDRVLVTAYTHRAVNNALRKIAEAAPDVRAIKAGKASAAEDLRQSRVECVGGLKRLPPPDERPTVAGATIFGLRPAWESGGFDRVVCDEAAQVPLAYAACAFLAGKRWLFVGDHRQMGPIVQGEHDDPLAAASVFEHLAAARPPVLLGTTYRMNEGIVAFPSRTFYGGRLAPAPEAAARRFAFVPGGPFDAVLGADPAAVLALVEHEGFRTRCEPEATAAVDLALDLLVRCRLPARDVAIVAPYRAQLRLIRTLLRRGLAAAGVAGPLPVVDTVERIQGQEREAVIVSLTASDPEHLAGEAAGFFFSPNRLNVTLTRARTKLVVVCSPRVFEAYPRGLRELGWADVFRRLGRELPAVRIGGPAG